MDEKTEMLFRLAEMDCKSECIIYKNAFNFLVNRYLFDMKLANPKELNEWAGIKRQFEFDRLFESLEWEVQSYERHKKYKDLDAEISYEEYDLRNKIFYLPLFNYFKEKYERNTDGRKKNVHKKDN